MPNNKLASPEIPREFYSLISQGKTIKQVADQYNVTSKTVQKYLLKCPDYQPPGSGNRRRFKGKKKTEAYKKVIFLCPPELIDELDKLPVAGNRTDKLIKAIALYVKKEKK